MGKLKYLHTVKKFPSGKFLVILESGVTDIVTEEQRRKILFDYYDTNRKTNRNNRECSKN